MDYRKHIIAIDKEGYIKYLESEVKRLEVKEGQTRFDRIVIDLVKEHIQSIK